jgi:formylglycine-generating enzyme required for sulfatase activity
VTGGTFKRDGNASYPATISGLRLDKYDVTVGRFRSFINAGSSAWSPATGSGKHSHLNGGRGLLNSGTGGGYETGWQSSWTTNLAKDRMRWTANLDCQKGWQTWQPTTGNDTLPINCVDWYEAYAFCIWDGGFLPSEAEFNYAFMGGSDENTYPWGDTAPGANASLTVYNCYYPRESGAGDCVGVQNIAPVGTVPAGNGVWGQSDLDGEVYEWLLDWYDSPYSTSFCNNCADTADTRARTRLLRGGSFYSAAYLLASSRYDNPPTSREPYFGFRCARTP